MGKNIIRILAGACTIGAWLLLWLSLRGGLGPRVDGRAYEASGRLVAQQALAQLAKDGQITVFVRDTAAFKNPATDIQLASFRKVIGKAHATIHSLRQLQVDPLRPIAVPSGDFCEAIRSTAKGSVIVSFMGPPLLTQAEQSGLGENKPAIVAFCSGGLQQLPDLQALFQQGLLQAAVVDCRGTERLPAGAANDRAGLERAFLMITAANVADLTTLREGNR